MSLSMIIDRTSADESNAITLRGKIQLGQTLTDAEKALFERGACTITMLNRIESAQAYVKAFFDKNAYTLGVTNKTWTDEQIFTYLDYQRLLSNLATLKEGFRKLFYVTPSMPNVPTYIYGYKEANDIEKILAELDGIMTELQKGFKKCGTFVSGGDYL